VQCWACGHRNPRTRSGTPARKYLMPRLGLSLFPDREAAMAHRHSASAATPRIRPAACGAQYHKPRGWDMTLWAELTTSFPADRGRPLRAQAMQNWDTGLGFCSRGAPRLVSCRLV